jgi:tryptophan-rich sensory protein
MDNNLNQKKVNYKMLILFIGLALLAGGIGALLGGNMDNFETLKKPPFSPPAILFPIVWTILYILMGISSYLICSNKTDQKFKNKASFVYILQLIVNSLWSLFFFRLNMILFAFIWLLLLILLVIIMIVKFYNIKPLAAYLQIPYILWLLFAAVLNFSIYLLNR